MKKVCEEIDYSFRTSSLSFFCYKAIEAFYSYLAIIAATIVLFIGVRLLDRPEDYPVFTVAAFILILCFYRGVTSLLTSEGILVSFVRCNSVIKF